MKRAVSRRLAVALIAFCLPLIPNSASAQEGQGKGSATTDQKPHVAYRIELTVQEVADGKRLNSRNYMMMAEDGVPAKIRVSDRVMIQTNPTNSASFQYHDVGMNIDCTPHERGDGVALVIQVEFSGITPRDQTAPPSTSPMFRTERTEVDPVVTIGKPTLVASMDDTETNRRFEIEVTATKVK